MTPRDRLRAMFAHVKHSMWDELIADRKAEAQRELVRLMPCERYRQRLGDLFSGGCDCGWLEADHDA